MTIKDIARISGYGISTVSRALNGHPDISDKTREKITEVAKKYNFVPNANARQLKATNSKTVSIIVKGTFNVFFSGMIENIQSEIDAAGLNVQVHYLHTSQNEVELAKKIMGLEKPLGIIFLGGSIDNYNKDFEENVNIPCILCSTTASTTTLKNLSSVSVDDFASGEKAIDYLISCGHKKIGLIGADITTICASGLRYRGCMKSFEENGVPFDNDAFEYAEFDFESSYIAAKKLIKRKPELTAIFAMSDTMAIGTIRAAADMGIKVPDDISVLGFDGIEFSSFCNPRITTYKQPQAQIAAITVRLLNQMIANSAKPDHILLKAEFQQGGSVKILR